MRQAASENGVPVIEAASELAKDPYVYTDFCHFGPLGHKAVAEMLAPPIRQALYTGSEPVARTSASGQPQ